MKSILIVIEEKDTEERMDLVLSGLLKDLTRSGIQKAIKEGRVYVNGISVYSKNHRLKTGDSVEILLPEPVALQAEPENIEIDIIYEDEALLVVDKPDGIVVHPAPGNSSGTLVNGVLYHCRGRLSAINGVIRPGIVHRLDKETSGLLVIAKTDTSHMELSRQFALRQVKRLYHAIVYNNFSEDNGTINAPIGRDPKNRLRMAVVEKNGKEAVTHYRLLERFGRYTYIEAALETGRTHQIRVHLAYINHPLLGDELYGPKKSSIKAERQMLHSKVLGFNHPVTGEYMEFDSPVPEDFCRTLEKIRQ